MSDLISPLVLTFNEAPNLARTLDALSWAREVVVLDSGSSDATLDIASSFSNVRIESRPFECFAEQFAAGAALCGTDWVLALDADHVLTPELSSELQAWRPDGSTHAYIARFGYCIGGRRLRASLYPPRVVLFDRKVSRYVQEGHHQVLVHPGEPSYLRGEILHDDRKPLARWLQDQDRYARQEAERLATHANASLSWQDRVRGTVVLAPALVFLGTLVGKRIILDGLSGWSYVCQRTIAELLLSLHLVRQRLERRV